MLLPISVTAPVRAKALPIRLAPLFMVMLACARIFPRKLEVVSRVAELPTRHCTLQGLPPLMKVTAEPLAAFSVLPVRKTQTASGLLWALRVRFPVSWADVEKQ